MKPGDLVRVKAHHLLYVDRAFVDTSGLGIVICPSERLRGHIDVCFNNKIWSLSPNDLERVDDQTPL